MGGTPECQIPLARIDVARDRPDAAAERLEEALRLGREQNVAGVAAVAAAHRARLPEGDAEQAAVLLEGGG